MAATEPDQLIYGVFPLNSPKPIRIGVAEKLTHELMYEHPAQCRLELVEGPIAKKDLDAKLAKYNKHFGFADQSSDETPEESPKETTPKAPTKPSKRRSRKQG